MSTEARRPAAGYTLLEVMIVVTIIGLLSALAVLRLPGSDAPARALAAAGRLALGFAELRDEARLTGMARGMGC
ncbi:MAG TPA: prepilin-type N-terminal cleavage/methylation domain-containing protein, partial [Plasticicumulans sp.]|nr:prepilin-type N-terminal cleavage/methylation domain-containing protein [Plasticicumulans sp.]